ncbi:hypothetical protein TSUD_24470 [Trifolium subterraneum]|uniref:Uncharacterized protein n=1 Tax=Trifolium subterraneum TaxID=3900 RepID=A0A2Z6NKK8_TRISU|nr:hypothetical protein TSUD_24470 [Trifolium subterraneum]
MRVLRLFAKMVAIEKATKAQKYIKGMMKKYPSSKAIKECATTDYDYIVSEFKASNPAATLTLNPNHLCQDVILMVVVR